MAEKTEILIDVQVDTGKVIERLAGATQNVITLKQKQAELRKEQRDLAKAFSDGEKTAQEYDEAMKKNVKALSEVSASLEAENRAVKSNTAILQAQNTQTIDNTMSLDEQRQAINTLQKAYASLEGDEKVQADAQGGLAEQIKNATDMLKEQEHAIGDDRRNVGNYGESMTKAFDDIAKSSQLLGSAASMLSSMGGEGKKAAAVLGMLQKVMDFVAKTGKMQAQATQAQTTSTNTATVAQQGLNAAMKANPIGLIITALTTLLPLIQGFCDGSKQGAEAQAAFNLALAGTQKALKSLQTEYDMTARMAEALGESEKDVYRIKVEGARRAMDEAVKAEDAAYKAMLEAGFGKRKAAKEYYEEARKTAQEATDEYNKLISDSIISDVKRDTKAKQESIERARQAAEEQRKAAVDAMELERLQRDTLQKQMVRDNKQNQQQIVEDDEEELEADIANVEEMMKRRAEFLKKFTTETAADVRDAELAELEELNAQKLLTVEQYEQARAQIEQAYSQQRLQAGSAEAEQWASGVMNAAAAVNEAINAGQNAQLEEDKRINDEKKRNLEKQLKAGQISEEKYNAEVQRLDEETAQKEAELAYEQAKRNKAFNIMQAVIDTALAIVNAFATMPFPASIAMAALAGATGAASIATIAAEPLPKFASGGVVGGTSYTGDKVVARLNSGEGVLTQRGLGNAGGLLEAADNGMLGGIDYQLLGATMAEAVAAQPAPVMVYSEFQNFERDVTHYNEIAAV